MVISEFAVVAHLIDGKEMPIDGFAFYSNAEIDSGGPHPFPLLERG